MDNYKVVVNSENNYKIKAITTLKMDMPPGFFDLTDVEDDNKYDKYVVTYDASSNKIVLVFKSVSINT